MTSVLEHIAYKALEHLVWKALENIYRRIADTVTAALAGWLVAPISLLTGDIEDEAVLAVGLVTSYASEILFPLEGVRTMIKTAVVLGGIVLFACGILLCLRSARPATQ
jgi:hypothetical protein